MNPHHILLNSKTLLKIEKYLQERGTRPKPSKGKKKKMKKKKTAA